MYKIFLLFMMAILLTGCSNGQNTVDKTNLSATEFAGKIKELGSPQLVDVRTSGEFEGGHLDNALNIDWNSNNFIDQASVLDKSKPVMVYCLSGGRSAAAAEAMRENGFKIVYEMGGGMMQWRAKGLPETKGNKVVQSLTIKQYKTLINNPDKLILVDFYAEWCTPCKKMEPYLNKISEDSKDRVIVIRIDADSNSDLCSVLKIEALPVLKLYKKGELIWEHLGFIEEAEVRKELKNK